MLSKLIKNIRAKPESVRKGITLATSLGITGVIGFFWLISYIHYSSAVLSAKPKVETPTNFLSKMGSLIGDSYANVRSSFDKDDSVFVSDTTVSDSASTTSSSTVSNPTEDPSAPIASSTGSDSTTTTTSASATTENNASSNQSHNASQGNSVDLQDILNTKN